jgi:UDP-N-acetylglucosamine acyltransferase
MSNIHPTAVIHPSAKIDPEAKIGPYAVIGEDVTIGAGTQVGAHATVELAVIGKNNILFPGCFVGTPPQDLKYAGERTRLVMGDSNKVRECVTLNRGTTATGETIIGSNCLFMAYSHVAHDCRIGNGVVVVNSVGIAGHVEIGDFTVVGGLIGIHQFVRIGRYCMLGGGSMIGKDIPDFCTCQGDRATLRGLNLVGMRRAGLGRETVTSIKDAYKTLFISDLSLEEALEQLRNSETPEVRSMVAFIEKSKRGVMRPASAGVPAEEEVTI